MKDDWRFKDFKDTKGAYNATLAVPTSGFARANFQSQYGGNAPSVAAPSATPNVNATSRIIPSPSNTNWNSTFQQNTPASPSGTDWQKTFGSQPSFLSPQSKIENRDSKFNFSLSPANTSSQLSLGSDDSDFYKSRLADTDITTRDHELYGAGPDYGFLD